MSGAEMLSALEHGVSQYPEPAGLYIHVAGIYVVFDPNNEPGERVMQVTMSDGSPFDLSATFTVATIDFITAGGDGYDLGGGRLVYFGSDSEILADFLRSEAVIRPDAEGRVRR